MEFPDWYPGWRHDAVHQLQEKNARLSAEFRLGDWPRYDYDLDAGTLIFSDKGVPKVIAEIQIAGSTSLRSSNWLWAWANSHWPADRVTDSELARAFGGEHGICDLIHDYVENDDDVNALGWDLTAVMVRITGAVGAYRPPDDNGGLYLVLRTLTRAS